MKYTTSSLLALGLTGGATAQWGDWSSSTTSSATVDGAKTSSTASQGWGPAKSSSTSSASSAKGTWAASTVTETSTVTVSATTTVYKSTVFVGPGDCTATVTVSAGETSSKGPWSAPAGSTPAAPVASSSTAAAAWGSSPAAPVASSSTAAGAWGSSPAAPAGSSPAAPAGSSPAGSWANGGTTTGTSTSTQYVTVIPTAGASNGGGWGGVAPSGTLDAGVSSGSIINTNQGWNWSPPNPTTAASAAAPTYSGWGDWSGSGGSGSGTNSTNGTGPAWGSPTSNVTKPFGPIGDNTCNSAEDRSQWCGGMSIDSDYYNSWPTTGKVCAYEWDITNTTLNFDGLDRLALAINGQVPGPLVECNWGDTLQVSVTNSLQDNATSIHWHGIYQKGGWNDQDGVPGVSECAIAPGDTRVYSFPLNQYGTGWYHSHVTTQLGDGVRGPMVIHGPATANYDIDMGTVMIDDLFGDNGTAVSAATENARIAHTGPTGTWNYMLNGANTFPDLSKGKHALWSVQSGKKHLFRIINSASQNMWSVHFDNHKMTVISTDYVPITPYETEWLNIGIGQRYDVIVEMDQPTAGYFLRAVNQLVCPSTCANDGLGNANGIFLYEGADATLPTSTAGTFNNNICEDEPLASLVPHLKKSAGTSSAFTGSASTMPAGNVANVATSDDGVVFRWFLNNGAIDVNYTQPTLLSLAQGVDATSNNSLISNPVVLETKNEWVYFVIQNQFFAYHPMHLHGHDMSVLGQGTVPWTANLTSTLNFDNPTRRDTAMLAGSAAGPAGAPGYTVIGFQTDNPGVWLMHCHIVWHVDGGLALEWIERPSDIPATKYASSPAFQKECSAMNSYIANGGATPLTSSSGLKSRDSPYFDQLLHSRGDNVVRRAETPEKRYIDSYLKRGLGDSHKARHMHK